MASRHGAEGTRSGTFWYLGTTMEPPQQHYLSLVVWYQCLGFTSIKLNSFSYQFKPNNTAVPVSKVSMNIQIKVLELKAFDGEKKDAKSWLK